MQIKIEKSQIYTLRLKKFGKYELLENKKKARFSKPASASKIAKLYTLSLNKKIIYVGITSRSLATRLRDGFKATGKTGYYGYKWKSLKEELILHIWTATEDGKLISLREMETIEAEVVFLCRSDSGQWPEYQNEIHFFESHENHRQAAKKIYSSVLRNSE